MEWRMHLAFASCYLRETICGIERRMDPHRGEKMK